MCHLNQYFCNNNNNNNKDSGVYTLRHLARKRGRHILQIASLQAATDDRMAAGEQWMV